MTLILRLALLWLFLLVVGLLFVWAVESAKAEPRLNFPYEKPMPRIVVLIVCKTVDTGVVDPNDAYTHHEERDWAITDGKMTCRTISAEVTNMGNPDAVYTPAACQRAAPGTATEWDLKNRESSNYRVWRVTCPTPKVRVNPDGSADVIDWVIPDCEHRETVYCEIENEI